MPRGRFLEAIVRRRWLFALAMAAITSLVLASAIHLPLGYTGEATLERRVDAAAQEALIAPGESSDSLRQIIHNELVGPAAVRQAVGNLPPFAARGATDDEIQRIGKALTVEWDFQRDQADRIRVLYTDRDPLVACQVPEALVRSYILRLSDRITQPLVVARDAARGELDASMALVAELSKPQPVEEAKAVPSAAAPVPAAPPAPAAATQASALRQEVDQIAAEIAAIRHRQAAAKERLELLKTQAAAPQTPEKPVQIVKGPNPDWKLLKDQQRKLQEEIDSCVTEKHMTENHPTMQLLRKKMVELTKRIAEVPEEAVLQTIYTAESPKSELAGPLAAAQAEMETTARQAAQLGDRLTKLQSLLANLPTAAAVPVPSPPQAALPVKPVQPTPGATRRLEEAKAETARCQERLKAAEAAIAAETARRDAQIAALQRAAAPPRITSPDLFNVLALALVGGLVFGIVMVLAADGLDRTITTPELAARCFGVPVLGVVTKTLTPKERARRRVRRFVLAPLAALVLLAVLCAAFFNTLAWLKYPDEFDDWKARPLGFASQKVQEWAEGLQGTL